MVLLALRLSGRLGATAFVALAVALVGADLFKAGMGYNPAIEERHAEQPTTPAIRFLQAQRPARFAGLEPEAKLAFAVPLTPSLAMRYGIYDARGYDYPVEERYAELWRRVITPSKDCNYAFCPESAAATPRALRALSLFGVTHLLQHRRDAPLRKLRAAYTGPDARIYGHPRPLPRAFLVRRQVVAANGDAARRLTTEGPFPLRTTAVTEEPIDGLAQRPAASDPTDSARVSSYEAERVVVRTKARRPALLVLTDSWFPGWKATVDGNDAPIHRVNYLIRGVPVPAGDSPGGVPIRAGELAGRLDREPRGPPRYRRCDGAGCGTDPARSAARGRARLVAMWTQRRPTAAAALLYGLLAFALFAPGLAPGKTLSASDYLWSAAPWEASRPDAVPGLGSNRELVDEVVLFQPQLQYTRAALPDVPLWDPHLLGGRPWMGDPQSSVFSRLQPAVVRAAVLEVAGGGGHAQGVPGRARGLPAGPGALACAWAGR